ncbi:MAG: hypothetical protein NZV14_08395 [Bryobacteraceae bacterium]|nr:hypothetical protein [Bryobacteraceae bacterium]MDW8378167.1 hypothetical protein [Bryobacterales bacterium]
MRKVLSFGLVGLILLGAAWLYAQDPSRPTFRVKVDMVVLTFTVTDSKGKYVNGLKPSDFRILEDGIVQKLNTFSPKATKRQSRSEKTAAFGRWLSIPRIAKRVEP